MSKILLVRPKNIINPRPNRHLPMGFLYLGTILCREGYKVKIIDASWEDDYLNLVSREAKDALLVGITALTSEVKDAYRITKAIKKSDEVPVVWGGIHPTLFPIQTCKDELVDFVIIGEGEYALLELVEALELNASPKDIKGLVYEENGVINVNRCNFLDVEKLPPIKYDLVDMSRYVRTGTVKGEEKRDIEYQASRGCPHRCAFCVNTVTGNQIYRAKSAEKVLDEIEFLIEKFKVDWITFVDDNFFVDTKRVSKICEMIVERNLDIRWFAECRADYFRSGFVDHKFLRLAKKAGWSGTTIGAESGSPRILKLIKKDITVNDVIRSAKMLNKHGIFPLWSFIIGFPNERKEDMLRTVKLIDRVKRICPNSSGGCGTFRPYPHCELTNSIVAQGWFKEPKSLKEWLKGEYAKMYTEVYYSQPWQEDPDFIHNVVHYTSLYLAYQGLNRSKVRSILDFFSQAIYVFLAIFRSRTLNFNFPFDRWIWERIHMPVRSFLTEKIMRKSSN